MANRYIVERGPGGWFPSTVSAIPQGVVVSNVYNKAQLAESAARARAAGDFVVSVGWNGQRYMGSDSRFSAAEWGLDVPTVNPESGPADTGAEISPVFTTGAGGLPGTDTTLESVESEALGQSATLVHTDTALAQSGAAGVLPVAYSIITAQTIARLAPAAIGPLSRLWVSLGSPAKFAASSILERLPSVLVAALAAIGVNQATEIVWDLATGNDDGAIQIGGGGGLGQITGNEVVKTWTANGIRFARLADGRMAAQRKDGTVRIWRPRKPIVIYSDGAKDIKSFLKADKALNKQAKRLQTALNRRAPRQTRAKKADSHTHYPPQGTVIRNYEIGGA